MTLPAVLLLADDESELDQLDALRRNIARALSIGADQHRAAGRTELADSLDAAAVRFAPESVN